MEKATSPHQNLPHRHDSVDSDDGGAQGQDTSSATGLLLERLQAWKHACGYLEAYIEATEKVQKAHAKEYEKIIKTINDPLREGHHFDQGLGGVTGLIGNMRTNTQNIANIHAETEKNLKGSVLPILTRLHSEIKAKVKELQSGAGKGIKAVDKARATTQKHIDTLALSTTNYETHGGKMDPANDPYVLQRGIYHRLHKQILEENASRSDVIAVQESFQQFESHVIQTIQKAMAAFNQFVGGQLTRQKVLYDDMLGTAQVIPLNFEWNGFVDRNKTVLIDPSAPPRTLENSSFPGQGHVSTTPIVEGTLERKGKIMKSYTTNYYVLTRAHFLHEMKDAPDPHNNTGKDPSPDLSLYLPDCTIGALAGLKFNVKGKDVSKSKVGAALSVGSTELAFKALSEADAKRWYEGIRAAAGGSSESAPTSPVESRKTSGQSPVGGAGVAPVGASGAGVGASPVEAGVVQQPGVGSTAAAGVPVRSVAHGEQESGTIGTGAGGPKV